MWKTVLLLMTIGLSTQNINSPKGSLPTYGDTRKLLSEMHSVVLNKDKLARLFRIGDERIEDLIKALDDQDRDISIRAQKIIRYLDNETGMKALNNWYKRQAQEHIIAGPQPLPEEQMMQLPTDKADLGEAVLDGAFFMRPDDKPYTSSRLLAMSTTKEKALVELHTNRGALMEVWYHVILKRDKGGWRFFSVTQVAVS